MELSIHSTPAKVTKTTVARQRLVAGDQLKMEIGPEDELDAVCPASKVWHVVVSVHIDETDA